MDKQELNTKIAEQLFGQTKEWQEWIKENCGEEFGEILDYTASENWGKVMEKLCERHGVNIDKIEITPYKSYSVGVEIFYDGGLCQYSTGEHQGDTIGEAVCRAVIAYKEAREANK